MLHFLTGPPLVVEINRLKYRKNASDSIPSLNPMSQSFLFKVPLIATNILLSELFSFVQFVDGIFHDLILY